MEKDLQHLLADGERLLWSARPESFQTLDKTNKTGILTATLIKLLICIPLLVGYVIAALGAGDIKPPVLIVLVALCAWVVTAPFLLARRLRTKTMYALTDRRVIRLGVNPESVPYDRIRTAALRADPDGHTTLLCGPKAVKLPPQRWRGKSDAGIENEPEKAECERMILYALPMDGRVEKLLKEHLPI